MAVVSGFEIEGPGQARPAPFLASTPVAPILGRFPFSLARTSGNTTDMGFVPRLGAADSNPRPTAKRGKVAGTYGLVKLGAG